MNRRRLLLGGAAVAGASALAAWRFRPEQGLWNPCLAPLPRSLAEHELVRSAWEGLDPAKVWDAHAHLVGTGDSPSGIRINPDMRSLLSPVAYAQRAFFMNAACAEGDGVDEAYVARLAALAGEMRGGTKLMLFAFERAHDVNGEVLWDHTGFYVPDAYARDVARKSGGVFEWVASIHPYRKDCVEALAQAKRDGARAVKWLPSAMGIDPGSPQCDRFYAAAARLDLPLISHAGEERAVEGVGAHDFGNPLKLRRALDAGVRVVVAHCASMGEDRDLDHGGGGPYVASFELFARLMGEARYEGRLCGDLSAVLQSARAGVLARVIREEAWHARLLNGSDYPLPGVMPLFSTGLLVSLGLLDPAAAPVLTEIRRYNPLLFDFVAKRALRKDGKGIGRAAFETRGFFDPLSSPARKASRSG